MSFLKLALIRGPSSRIAWILVASLLSTSGCGSEGGAEVCGTTGSLGACPRCPDYDELRRPYFGDTHVHTTLSFDANTSDTRLGPLDAYKYARGQTVGVQPYDENGNSTRSATIDRPLDFVAVTDHAEGLGTVRICEDPDSMGYSDPTCVEFREDPGASFLTLVAQLVFENGYPNLCGEGGQECLEESANVWQEVQQAAAQAHDHCNFTSFVAYEWTCTPNTDNLHRNVIFRNGSVPDEVLGCFEDPDVEGLWRYLRAECIDADTGCDALTIPHNPNLSNGIFFENRRKDGSAFDAAYVAERAAMEPLIEIYQHKGASECLPDAPLISDEVCGFEILPHNDFFGHNFAVIQEPNPLGTIRGGLGEGMRFEDEFGTNPFKHGIVAATDTHAATPGGAMETPFVGHGAAVSTGIAAGGFTDNRYDSAGGHGVVWAEENSREAIFEGMRRKETYGTSGPRMIVRFFGGWDYPSDICNSSELVKTGYENGVPMGGDLATPPSAESKPIFIVSALQDPGTQAQPAAPLQRIQIIKGWVDAEGELQVKVTDVAGSDNDASVDIATCETTGEGSSELCTRWVDEEFDPTLRAYYYARVLENPSCRWTTWQCVEGGYDCNNPTTALDEDCCDPVVGLNPICSAIDCGDQDGLTDFEKRCCLEGSERINPIIQERAWTSPIWHTP